MLMVWKLKGGRLLYCLSHQGSVQDMKVGREKTIMTSSNKSLYMHLVSVGRTGLVSLTLVRLRGHTRLDCDYHWLLSDPVRPSDLAVRPFR